MATTRTRLAVWLFLTPVFILLTMARVEAQDKWSFVFTPQVWFENIRNSGFSAATNAGAAILNGVTSPPIYGIVSVPTLKTDGSDPTSTFFPQWGGQFAAQHGPWTFGVAGQYLSYETSQEFSIQDSTTCTFGGSQTKCFNPLLNGQRLFTEKIDTDRVDVDVTATYFFPDVIKDVLDVTTGLGFKWIRASGQRTLTNNGAHLFQAGGVGVPSVNYILKSCGNLDSFARSMNSAIAAGGPSFDPGNCQRNQTSFLDQQYGGTIPTTLNFRPTRDGKWLVPVTMTPFLGAEVRTDQILGSENKFAYGGTFDVGVRYVFDNGIAVFGGWRGQVFQGIDLFFSQGPVFNLSVRFGEKG